MDFDYFITTQSMGLLSIEDIGNCAIDGFNGRGEEFILVVDTNLGRTRIFTFGPFVPDMETLPNEVSCTVKQINFSTQMISKHIRQWINNGRFVITQAIEIEKEEALDKCRNLVDYMRISV